MNDGIRSTAVTRRTSTPASALQQLAEGNERFVGGRVLERDHAEEVTRTSAGQKPLAAVLGCVDARVPVEIVLDQGVGDLLVARVAGNVVNDDIVGSLEFATQVAGVGLIVVMGHSDCGAVKAACDGARLGLLTGTLAKITPAIEAVRERDGQATGGSENAELVRAVAEANVAQVTEELPARSDILRGLVAGGEVGLVGAIYDVRSGRVSFHGEPPS